MVMTPMERLEPLDDATPLLDCPEALRERAREDGYLFFRGLLDPREPLALRRDVLSVCERHGLLAPGSPLDDGVAREGPPVIGSVLREGPFHALYRDILALPRFNAAASQPPLLAAFERLFGEPALPHRRTIGRVVFPATHAFTTAPHQDHVYIRGTTETWTCWVPLGYFPEELGPVAVLRGSHRAGLLPLEGAFGPGGVRCDLPVGYGWVSSELEPGDVVCFHSLTFHQGRDNATRDRLRLSIDCRLQPGSHPIDPSSLQPHLGFITWEEIDEVRATEGGVC
jgi:hypothetical protein